MPYAAIFEAAASEIVARHSTPPGDSFALARALGLVVEQTSFPSGLLIGDCIEVCARFPAHLQNWVVAHELGHYTVRKLGLPNTERHADQMGEALLLPRALFASQLDACGWDLSQLLDHYPNTSYETLARRVLSLHPSVAVTVWDRGRLTRRRCSSGAPEALAARPSKIEALLAGATAKNKAPTRLGERVWGFPGFVRKGRVVTLCAGEAQD
jgi:hypothetical protein